MSSSKRKRLLICTPSHSLQGGVERIIESLHDELVPFGFDVIVGLARGRRFHVPERFLREYPRLRAVEIAAMTGTREGRLRALCRTMADVKPDIVLMARLADVYPVIAEAKLGGSAIRLAVTIQAYEADYIHDLKHYADFVDACITSGELIARAVREFTTLPADRIASIPGGVEPARRVSTGPMPARPLRILYVGRLDARQKRIFDLADLLDRLDDAKVEYVCSIAGSGADEAELRARLGNRARFLGWQSHDALYASIYPDADVFVHFAAWEGVTIAPREAMVHGVVPVISRFVGSRAEGMFEHDRNALTFEVGDVASAARFVQLLQSDVALWRRLSSAAAQSQGGVRSASGAIAAWADVLDRALARTPAAGLESPQYHIPPAGTLDRVVGPHWAERVRQALGKFHLHDDPGGEWPHATVPMPESFEKTLLDFARRAEEEFSGS